MSGPWAVFLDRDGTINEEVGLIDRPERLKLIPGAGEALRALKGAGALLILATNQPVVARGMLDEEGLAQLHKHFEELLNNESVSLDAIYYCPHHPEKGHPEAPDPHYRRVCECRKPKPGMLLEAAKRFNIDMKRSFFVGDSTRDIAAANTAGCRSVLVKTGFAGDDGTCPDAKPDAVKEDLRAASEWILSQAARA